MPKTKKQPQDYDLSVPVYVARSLEAIERVFPEHQGNLGFLTAALIGCVPWILASVYEKASREEFNALLQTVEQNWAMAIDTVKSENPPAAIRELAQLYRAGVQ